MSTEHDGTGTNFLQSKAALSIGALLFVGAVGAGIVIGLQIAPNDQGQILPLSARENKLIQMIDQLNATSTATTGCTLLRAQAEVLLYYNDLDKNADLTGIQRWTENSPNLRRLRSAIPRVEEATFGETWVQDSNDKGTYWVKTLVRVRAIDESKWQEWNMTFEVHTKEGRFVLHRQRGGLSKK